MCMCMYVYIYIYIYIYTLTEVVLAAVAFYGLTLQHASEALRGDREVNILLYY